MLESKLNMKYRHISAHLGIRQAWLIPTHQNSKPLLMSRYTTVTHMLFLKVTLYSYLRLKKMNVRITDS